jgi:hypothetical protein
VTGLDPAAAAQLKSLRDDYREVGIDFIIAGCSGTILHDKFKKLGIFSDWLRPFISLLL